MLEIKDLSIYIYPRYLIKSLSLSLNKNDKLAIIGEEGNGKSTLLKSILGICDYADISGSINLKNNKIGYLEQSINDKYLEYKVYDYLFIDDKDYYNKINLLYKILDKLSIEDSLLDQYTNTLSGGEKVKIGLLKILLDDVDILFLDEPSNDLDIDTLKWLENFIKKEERPIVFISHDETLLSATANIILHLEQIKRKSEPRHTLLKTDYITYVETRLKKITTQTQIARNEAREYKKTQNKLNQVMQSVEYKQRTISRKDPYGAACLKVKMRGLKAQEKRLEKTILTEVPDVEENINIFFEKVNVPNQKRIIKLEIPELKAGNKLLSKNIKLEIYGNKHICIIGKNGVGKTTLIKEIYKELKDRTDIKVGYMPQIYEDIFYKDQKVLEFVCPSNNKDEISKIRTYLGNLKFTSDEMEGKISNLSNGSKAKLIISKLIIEKYNVLILDEPTRNVSPLSNPIIRKSLKEYNGTIISISHDRKYIEEVAEEIFELTKEGLITLDKDYIR